MGWCAQDEVTQEDEFDRTKKGTDSTGKVLHIQKRSVGDL